MRRFAFRDVTLSNGLTISKGERIIVDSARMTDEAVYKDHTTWDPYRFLNLRRESGNEHWAQLVTTHPNHLGFGHGLHACPGRFFAANEVKVALSHLLIKYDWKLAPGSETAAEPLGFSLNSNTRATLLIRRRAISEMEVDIDNI